MGQAIDFPQRNDFIGKPPETTENQVYALPVCRMITLIPGPTEQDPPVRVHAHVSFWEFTDEEIESIVKNRGAFVKIIGRTLFPMSVHGNNPINPEGEFGDRVFSKEEIIAFKRAQ